MKAVRGDLRRSGRGFRTYARRVRRSHLDRLQELWGSDGGAVRQPHHRQAAPTPVRKPPPLKQRQAKNWNVRVERGEVLALEPGQEHEHVFEGGKDPFLAALEYAAKKIREGQCDGTPGKASA